jgi:nucleoside-diphosphate-sugar epimerase
MAKILLVGGTGTIGSALGSALIQRGHLVYFLVRPKEGEIPEQRVRDALSFYGQDSEPLVLSVIQGDITASPYCGLFEDDLNCLKGEVEEVINCAADVGFGQTREQSWLTNVRGVQNLLKLAELLGAKRLHHFSSTYVCGKREGIIYEDDLNKEYGFHNVYEETKCEAEILLRDKTKNPLWRNTIIYRLGVVLGDSQRGGKISRFNGYYGFTNALFRLGCYLIDKIKRTPETFSKAGIEIKDGDLVLPIKLSCDDKANLSMVSLDKLVETFLRIRESKDSSGLTFHLTSKPIPCQKLIEIALEELKIKGVKIIGEDEYKVFKETDNKLLLKLENGFYKMSQDYLSYLSEERWFDTSNLRLILGEEYEPPVIEEDQLRKTLSYAIGMFKEREYQGAGRA